MRKKTQAYSSVINCATDSGVLCPKKGVATWSGARTTTIILLYRQYNNEILIHVHIRKGTILGEKKRGVIRRELYN